MCKNRKTLKTTWEPFCYTNLYPGSPWEAKCLRNVSAEIEYFTCSYKAEVPSGLKQIPGSQGELSHYYHYLHYKEKYPLTLNHGRTMFQAGFMPDHQEGWKRSKSKQVHFRGRQSLQHTIVWEKVYHFSCIRQENTWIRDGNKIWAALLVMNGHGAAGLWNSNLCLSWMVGGVWHGGKLKAAF